MGSRGQGEMLRGGGGGGGRRGGGAFFYRYFVTDIIKSLSHLSLTEHVQSADTTTAELPYTHWLSSLAFIIPERGISGIGCHTRGLNSMYRLLVEVYAQYAPVSVYKLAYLKLLSTKKVSMYRLLVEVYAQYAPVSVYKLAYLKLLSTKKVSFGCALGWTRVAEFAVWTHKFLWTTLAALNMNQTFDSGRGSQP